MSEFAKPIDITTSVVLEQLVRQLQETNQPIPLTRNDEVVAVVQPAPTDRATDRAVPPLPASAHPPQDFYAEAVARPDVAEILRRLERVRYLI